MIKHKKQIIVVLFIFMLFIIIPASFADENTTNLDKDMNTGIIYVSTTGNDDNIGTNDQPVLTINKSIELASKKENQEHKIIVGEGNYTESNLNIASAIDISADGNVIIDANKKSRILNIETPDEVKISGITFKNGWDTEGGAISIIDAKVTINNCTFINNAAAEGGAIFWNADYGVLSDSYFSENRARTASAISWGGLKDYSYETKGENGLIINTIFDNNDNANTNGNCMGLIIYSNNVTVVNCSFTNNNGRYASTGGSLHLSGDYIKVDGCLFENNTMDQAPAIQCDGDFSQITNCFFINNTINSTEIARAGAVQINSLNSIVSNNTFIGNGGENCYNGGAIAVMYDGFAGDEVIEIINNRFINNSAVYGASIFIDGGYESYCIFKEMIIDNNTFDGCEASTTAGVYVRNVDLENSIVNVTNNIFKNLISTHTSSIFIDYASVKLANNTIINCTSLDDNNHIFNYEGYISGNLTVTVNNNDTVELLAGKTIDVNASVVDDMNNSISGGIIRFIVQGSDVDENGFSLENGTATVTFKSSVVGMFLVSADYTNGDLANIKTSIVIALPYDIVILFENKTGLTGENITIPVIVVVNSYMLENENITISFNNETYNLTVINGTAEINLTLPENGTYNLTVGYDIQSETQEIIVKDNSVVLNAPTVNVTPNTGKFNVTLKDSENNPLSGEKITVKFNGQTQTLTTDENGTAEINLNLSVGTYDVTINYVGSLYKSANITSTISVDYLGVILTTSDINMTYGDGTAYVLRLTDSSFNPLAGQNILININDEKRSFVTDSNGLISMLITEAPGNYTISAIYNGTEIYNSSKVENNVSVNSYLKITSKDLAMYYSDSKLYTVTVYGYDGKPAEKGEIVKIVINKKTYTAKTNANGVASLKITLTPKTYTAKATYKNLTVSNKIVVKKVLTAKNISKKKAKTIKFQAKLAKGKKVLAKKKLKFKIKGKTYTAKTNKKGIATIKLKNLKVGKYTIYTYYNKSKIKNTIRVKK